MNKYKDLDQPVLSNLKRKSFPPRASPFLLAGSYERGLLQKRGFAIHGEEGRKKRKRKEERGGVLS